MAAAEEHVELEEEEATDDSKGKKVPKHDSGAADLEKVTDYVEEAEISQQSIEDAMKVVKDQKANEAEERRKTEKELSKVKINREDIDLIANEMEVSHTLAERKLREHKGDVVSALRELTN